MATLRQVETGTVTLAASSASQTVTLATTLLDTTKTLLIFGMNPASNSPQTGMVRGEVTSTTTLTFSRDTGTSAPAITIRYYVIEWTAGVTVQRGLFTATVNPGGTNQAISAVNLAKAWPVLSWSNGGTGHGGDDWITADLTTTTNLQFNIETSSTAIDIAWQVIEYDNAVVEKLTASFATGDTSKTATPTSIDNGALFVSYYVSAGTAANIGQKMTTGRVSGSDIVFERANSGATTHEVIAHWVRFTDAVVRMASAAFGTGDTQIDSTIASVTTASSVAYCAGMAQRGGRTGYSADDNPSVATFDVALTSATNARATRGTTGSATAVAELFVIDFGATPGSARVPSGLSVLVPHPFAHMEV